VDTGTGRTQMVLQVANEVMTRADCLRIVMRTNRARVLETALTVGGLPALEREHAGRLERLAVVAQSHNKTLAQYAAEYADKHQRKTYGPTLEECEEAAARSLRAREVAARRGGVSA